LAINERLEALQREQDQRVHETKIISDGTCAFADKTAVLIIKDKK